jgi:hypothetical protein
MNQNSVKIYTVRTTQGIKCFASLISSKEVFKNGLIPESIIGYFINQTDADNFNPQGFVRNSIFIEFLHSSIAEYAPRTKSFQVEARRQWNGILYLIDQRTPDPAGNVPAEDIIGSYSIDGGEIINGSYKANTNYKILTKNGFFKLSEELNRYLINQILKLYEIYRPSTR